ncbi:sugar phosphate isomerase/epimerase family protein [Rubrimonas cliftonensis]|uniref:Sugar phosphate isomerase/epimerase n=1 Tax=Rubrimonas cliftonensis TaxID=89524 RepID=A0A1H4B7U9_9RHOB|nr:sugar phosphate isomerase/epimerase family protein [Rubrimonas cliftonensis]SEA44166.1 Sugar phosphate isomerase/epimerase [Rubrimonas cliftonensis]
MAEDGRPPGAANRHAAGQATGLRGVGLSLGYSADTLSDLPAAIDAAEALGVDSVEIFLPALGVVIDGRVRPRALAMMRGACAGRGCAITLHGPLSGDLGAEAAAPLQAEVVRACLETAAEVGCGVLVQHATVAQVGRGADFADARRRERDALAALAEDAAAARCVIALETMWARPGERTATGDEIAETLCAVASPWVGATIDFSHSWLNAVALGVDPMACIAALAPHARHLHVHDSFGRPATFRPWTRGDALAFGFGDLHLPPGEGSLPWEALAALPYAGPALANLEVDGRFRHAWADSVSWARRWIGRSAAPGAAPARADRAAAGCG